MLRPHRAIFRQQTYFKESTELSTLSIVFLKYVIVINFGVVGCIFSLSYVLHHWVRRYLGRVYLVLIFTPCNVYVIYDDISLFSK
jgi:hypothetical protein